MAIEQVCRLRSIQMPMHIEQLKYMDIGVKYAQKAWLKKENDCEYMDAREFKRLFEK